MDKYKRGKTIAIIPVAAAASVASVMTVACDSSGRAGQQRPNIIVFLVDDMGLMDTSVPFLTDPEGQPVEHPLNRWYRTPNMQRLVLRPERQLAVPRQPAHRPERYPSRSHQLDILRVQQPQHLRPARLELAWLRQCRLYFAAPAL